MPHKKGTPRPLGAGRKKGTPNKKTMAAIERAAKLGIDPFTILLWFAAGDWASLGYPSKTEEKYTAQGVCYTVEVITPSHRLSAAMSACEYIHPKRKPIDPSIGSESAAQTINANVTVEFIDESDDQNAAPYTPTKESGPVDG